MDNLNNKIFSYYKRSNISIWERVKIFLLGQRWSYITKYCFQKGYRYKGIYYITNETYNLKEINKHHKNPK